MFEPEMLGQSHTTVSNCACQVNETMYISILIGYDSPGGFLSQPTKGNEEPVS